MVPQGAGREGSRCTSHVACVDSPVHAAPTAGGARASNAVMRLARVLLPGSIAIHRVRSLSESSSHFGCAAQMRFASSLRRVLLLLLLVQMLGVRAAASDYGVLGLIDMPVAHMREEGELSTVLSSQAIADIYSITYQPTPWAEVAFRYTIFNPYRRNGSVDDLKDRSFEAKFRLVSEEVDGWQPDVSVGLRDLLGTGVWSGEYLVASKRLGPLDASLGMGWGRFATRDAARNPLRLLSDNFSERDRDFGLGGEFDFDSYFSGKRVGVFGGVRYSLPRWNLDLLAEYNSDNYAREIQLGTIDDADPWSFGVEWEPADDLQLGLSWQQGNQLGLRIAAQIDTASRVAAKAPNGFGARGTRSAPVRRFGRNSNWFQRMASDAEASGLLLRSAKVLDERTVQFVYSNQTYQLEADAVRRVLELAELYAPRAYRRIVLTSLYAEVLTHSVSYLRSGREEWASETVIPEAAQPLDILPALDMTDPDFVRRYRYPNVAFNYNFSVRTYLFDPDDPFRAQLFARVGAEVDLGHGFGLSTSYVQNIYNQFDEIERGSNSVLPRVRSDAVRYLQEGDSGIDRLVVTKRGQLADNVYYMAFGGILEEMYGGVGGEVLWRPFGSRVAFGANVIGVRQRDFDKGFGFRDYENVIGHVSSYWASPFYGMDLAVHAGRYLARDWGATFEVQKRFPNGWSVGAFATFTEVPFDEFGEGSFDKGLYFRVPFNPFVGFNTRSAYSLLVRPIQRDGGQRLNWGFSLWEDHRATNYDHLASERNRMFP